MPFTSVLGDTLSQLGNVELAFLPTFPSFVSTQPPVIQLVAVCVGVQPPVIGLVAVSSGSLIGIRDGFLARASYIGVSHLMVTRGLGPLVNLFNEGQPPVISLVPMILVQPPVIGLVAESI